MESFFDFLSIFTSFFNNLFKILLDFYDHSPDHLKFAYFVAAAAVALLFFGFYVINIFRSIDKSKKIKELEERIEEYKKIVQQHDEWSKDHKEIRADHKEELEQTETNLEILKKEHAQKDKLLTERTTNLKSCENRLKVFTNIIKELSNSEGKFWYLKPSENIPAFRLKDSHHATILTIMNFKGGVGKTLLSLLLGATFLERNKKVLVIDLDYQGSLTEIALPPGQLAQNFKNINGEKNIQHIFEKGLDADINLLKKQIVILNDNYHVIPAWTRLLNIEDKLHVQWIFNYLQNKDNTQDVRFILRNILHNEEIQREYDYILFDCPPRLTLAAVNALCASDGMLIPVIPDIASLNVVPRIVRSLRNFMHESNILSPQFNFLGVVANRVQLASRTGNMVSYQKAHWEKLDRKLTEQWGKKNLVFNNFIRQANADCMNTLALFHSHPQLCPYLKQEFYNLADEIENRL